jgi:hypothetical protein
MTATTTLVLGGGFGGISAANTLRRLLPGEHPIALVDSTSHFHIGAGKTWIMLGERLGDISRPRTELLDPGVLSSKHIVGLDLSNPVATDKERCAGTGRSRRCDSR